MTIRRNADKTLPASHMIELIFLTPADFDGGGIDKVLRFTLKETEEVAGKALLSFRRPRSPTAISWWRSTTPRRRSPPISAC